MNDRIRNLMDHRVRALGAGANLPSQEPAEPSPLMEETSYGIHLENGLRELFVEFLFQNGNRVAFPYADLGYLNFEAAESRLDLGFRDYLVSLYGSNLDGALFEALMDHRVRWIREPADEEAAPHDDATFVEVIEITPPETDYPEEPYEEATYEEETAADEDGAPGADLPDDEEQKPE